MPTPLPPKAVGVLAAALLLRLGAASCYWGAHLSRGGDDGQYAEISANLAAGRGFALGGAPTAYRAPLYPLFLAALRKTGLAPERGIRVAQAFVGAAAVWLAFELGGLPAMALTAADPAQALLPSSLYSECFYSILVLLVAWALASWRAREDDASAARLGLACGVSTLCRSTLVLVPVLALLFARSRGRALARQAAILLAAAAVPVLPWVARNLRAFDRLIVAESGVAGPIVYYASEGRVRPPADEAGEEPMRAMYRGVPRGDWDRHALGLAARNVLSHPARYAWSSAARVAAFWSDAYLPYLVHDHPDHARWIERWWTPVEWACRLALVAVCALAWRGALERSAPVWACLLLLAYANVHALGVVFARYHAPFMPLLYVVAGTGLSRAAST